MSFFICLVRLTGEPVTAADRRRIIHHLMSRGINDATDWEDAGSLSALVRRSGESGPRLARVGSMVGVGDVRLDNPEQIVSRLSDPPVSATHLELALREANAHGTDSALALLGDFAYVTWESGARRLVAIRDALGVKPLFYCRLPQDLLAFSSHASLLGIGGAVSEEYIAKYFVRSRSEEQTIFDSVDVVPAAHALSVTDGRPSLRRYWFPDRIEIDPRRSRHEAVEEFRTLFAESVRLRLVGRGPVWSELSGGLDTSSVVSISSWLHRSGTVDNGLSGTITYADSLGSGDESEFVGAVVQASGVRNEQVRDSWPWRDDGGGPIRTEKPGPSTLFWFRNRQRDEILRKVRAQVLLSGLGGDHILEGNLSFFADRVSAGSFRGAFGEMAHWAALQQRSFWRFAFRFGVLPFLPAIRSRLISRERHRRVPAWVASDFRKRSDMDAHLRRNSVPRLTEGPLSRYRAVNVERVVFLARSLPRDEPLIIYERRFPFLYRPLVELALRLPPEFVVHPNARKVALREAMQGVLPELVRTRLGKGGVDTRMLWALSHERGLIESMLRDPVLAQMGYVDAVSLRNAYVAARTGKQRLTVPLFNTLALETWMSIETGRWPRLEGARSASHFLTGKEKARYARVQEAVPEARADRAGLRREQHDGHSLRGVLRRQPERPE